jgi:hypothetical protein
MTLFIFKDSIFDIDINIASLNKEKLLNYIFNNFAVYFTSIKYNKNNDAISFYRGELCEYSYIEKLSFID